MTKFKKPKSFRLSDSSRKKNPMIIKWLFLILFLILVFGAWAFFQYGISYLARFSSFFNDSSGKEITSVIKNTIPPAPPVIDPLPEATNSAILEVFGEAEFSSELSLFLNGKVINNIIIGDSGKFRVGDIGLNDGENIIFALATNMAGNKSQESVRQTIILDKEPPKLKIEFPENKQSFSGDEKEVVIRGETEGDATITVNERKVVIDLGGRFEAPYSLTDGANTIIILVGDRAGNQTKEELIIYYRP